MKLQLKRSNVLNSGAAKEPTASQLEYGELAINYSKDDPAIFLKDSNNNIIRISGVGNIADDGQVELPASTTPPLNPEPGNLWYNSADGRLYIYYADGDSEQWVDASPDSWDPTSYPDITDDAVQPGTLDNRYLMLNAANDPITGGLNITGGNVGIGTSAPAASLQVQDNSGAPGTNLQRWAANLGTNTRGATLIAPETDSVSDPFIFFTNNSWQFRVDVTDALTIDSGGRVGIGTNSPSYALDVLGEAEDTYIRVRANSSNSNTVGILLGDAATGAGGQIKYQNTSNFMAINTNGAERMRIDSSGNVGIGTDAPQSRLTVKANLQSAPTLTWNTGSQFILGDNSVQLAFGRSNVSPFPCWLQGRASNNAARNILINPLGGDVGIGTTDPQGELHVSSTGTTRVFFEGNSGRSEIRASNGNFAFFANGSADASGLNNTIFYRNGNNESMRINTDGNVGIGLTDPSEKLEVNGTIKATDINFTGLATYADDTAAGTGGLVAGDVYKTSTGELRIKL